MNKKHYFQLIIIFIAFIFSSCSSLKVDSNIDYFNGVNIEIINKISDKYFETHKKVEGYEIYKLYYFVDENDNDLYIFKFKEPNLTGDAITGVIEYIKIGNYYFENNEKFYIYFENEDKMMLLIDAYEASLVSDSILKELCYKDYRDYPYDFGHFME